MRPGAEPTIWRCPECGFEAQGGLGTRCGRDGRVLVPRDTLEEHPGDPLLGHVLVGRYALFDVLGSGGMGAVYHAVQDPIGREVAVKTILPPSGRRTADPALRERFFHEARVLAELKSPQIVRLFDFGEDEAGRLYMVQELVRGESLDGVLWRRHRLPLELAAGVATRVLEALAEPHARGLVHRDIKPGNVMIGVKADPSGEQAIDDAVPQVTLIDFGLVKALFGDEEDSRRAPLTRTGMAVGTPRYMAPEQLGRGRVGPWTDQYAVGVLLFQMLAGETPYEGTTAEIIAGHLKDPVPPLPAHVGAPPAIEAVVRRALDKQPDRRFPDCAAMAAAIAEALDRSAAAAGLDDLATRVHGDRKPASSEIELRERRTRALRADDEPLMPARSGVTRVLRDGKRPDCGTKAIPTGDAQPDVADFDELPPTVVHTPPPSGVPWPDEALRATQPGVASGPVAEVEPDPEPLPTVMVAAPPPRRVPVPRPRVVEPTVPMPRAPRSWTPLRLVAVAAALAAVASASAWAVWRAARPGSPEIAERRPPPPPADAVTTASTLGPWEAPIAPSGAWEALVEPTGAQQAPVEPAGARAAPTSVAAVEAPPGSDGVPPDEAHLRVAAEAPKRPPPRKPEGQHPTPKRDVPKPPPAEEPLIQLVPKGGPGP